VAYTIRPEGWDPRTLFPMGRCANGTMFYSPYNGKKVHGVIVGYKLTKLKRWVIIIRNTVGTTSIPKDNKDYNVHEEQVTLC